MNPYAIRIENLSKRYKIGRKRKENLTETLVADIGKALNGASKLISQMNSQKTNIKNPERKLYLGTSGY